ncbi:MAG: hypothetical protein HDR04_13475 [Lachnospiraceae bacterium]|nr:hypothetical protein [Lachnospiraceae bacterium]
MDNLFSDAVVGLESYKTGEPFIITRSGFDEDGYLYAIVAYVRTVDDWTLRYIDAVHMRLFLPFTYPVDVPRVKVLRKGFFQSNFTADGGWIDSDSCKDESIYDYLSRLILDL